MTANSTKKLAKQLGLLKRTSSGIAINRTDLKKCKLDQIFSYLVVLDFESTCWQDKNNSFANEVIEFPAVLVNVKSGQIEDKFHYYVQPAEHGKLSAFCTELTGIQQSQVDDGIPIGVCLRLFTDWLHKHISEKKLYFPSASKPTGYHKAILVTWTDWDLSTCLQNECYRKRITYTPYLKSWIDLRKTFRTFYDSKPEGLNGALKQVGIKFEGRQHSGIDDATNTAYLALRMVRDGCVLKATKSLILSTDLCNRYDNLSLLNDDKNCDNVEPFKKLDEQNLEVENCITVTSKSPLKDQNGPGTTNIAVDKKLGTTPVGRVINIGKSKKFIGGKIRLGLSKHTPVNNNERNEDSCKATSITPPLCDCGKRSKRKKVINPGPNTGRVFYLCPLQKANGCKYFKWEESLLDNTPSAFNVNFVVDKKSKLKKHYQSLFNNV